MLNVTGQLELFPDFKIDISADRSLSKNYSEQYDVSANGDYNPRSPYAFGNYSTTTIMIKTAFKHSDEISSSAFNDFANNRLIVADRLASSYYGANIPRYGDLAHPLPAPTDPNYAFYVANLGYPIGYGKNSQQVLIPSFLSAYTGVISREKGRDASKISLSTFRDIPLPNWNVKYTGLMR